MRRLVVHLAVTGLLAGGVIATSAQAAPAAPAAPAIPSATGPATFIPDPIEWGDCGSDLWTELGFECGYLVVPLDYADPTGTKIALAVSRIKHLGDDADYQGVMLTNPGGPGGSGLVLPVLTYYVPNDAGANYDWIGFDPRGVGQSLPALSCDGDYTKSPRPQYVPTSTSIKEAWLAKAAKYSDDCADVVGDSGFLEHLKTTDSVQDMDTLRVALGEEKINFYGFSYGTYLGQVYSTLYPQHSAKMVFDGVVNPERVWYPANLDQDAAFDKSIKVFFQWVADNDATYGLGTSESAVEKLYYANLAKLGKNPAGGKLGAAEWTDVFLSAGYYVYGWADIAAAFSSYVHDGDWQAVFSRYDDGGPDADNGYAIYLAVQCSDVAWPKNWNKWAVDNYVMNQKAPFETWANAWFNAPCLNWHASSGTPVTVNGSAAPPFLLINETLDAATPYSGALKVRSLYPTSRLIEGVGGTTHAGSLSGVSCVDDAIAAYLADGTLPARRPGIRSDVQCPPVPAPEPNAGDNLSTMSVKKVAANKLLNRYELAKSIGPRAISESGALNFAVKPKQ